MVADLLSLFEAAFLLNVDLRMLANWLDIPSDLTGILYNRPKLNTE
jgi:hypothetical protein